MKVLHVIQSLSPRYGGPVSVLKDLAKAQKRSGLDVTVYTTNMDYPKGVYCEPGVQTLEDFSEITIIYHKANSSALGFSWSFAHRIKTQINNYDIIHIHGLYRFPLTYAAYQARIQGIPYIICPHGSLDPFLYKRSTSGSVYLKRVYEKIFDFPNLNNAAAIHFTAEEECKRASSLGLLAPSFIIPNGLNWENYKKLPKRGIFRTTLGLDDKPTVLFLGRLHVKKGLDLLIPAFKQIQAQHPNAVLLIAGPDNDNYGIQISKWIKKLKLESNVLFLGHLDHLTVIQAYVDSDVFVLPSYTENFGMTVVEAMACKLPVVISDQVNIHTKITESESGLVTRCDVNEVAEAVMKLINNPELRKSMGEAGRIKIESDYTWPNIVKDLTSKYSAIISNGSHK